MKNARRKAEDLKIWKDLVRIEPRLQHLADLAIAFKKSSGGQERVCANDRWYGYREWVDQGIRTDLINLVGWRRKDHPNPLLKTTEAYDIAYLHIYNLLPDCRNCGCISR